MMRFLPPLLLLARPARTSDGHAHGGGSTLPYEWGGMFWTTFGHPHTWLMQQVNGSYADPTMEIVFLPTNATPSATNLNSLEGAANTVFQLSGSVGCTSVNVGETITPTWSQCFLLNMGAGAHAPFTINTAGYTALAIFSNHVPTEFEWDSHYFLTSTGVDNEPVAQLYPGGSGHDHGGDDESSGAATFARTFPFIVAFFGFNAFMGLGGA